LQTSAPPASSPVGHSAAISHQTNHTITLPFRSIYLWYVSRSRVPQILHSRHLLDYSPHLLSLLASHTPLASGSELEISLRSLSIVCVEELRAALVRRLRDAGRDQEAQRVNAVTLDFWLWNEAKRREKAGEGQHVECHRTRGIWY
jgi:hypothetical protein